MARISMVGEKAKNILATSAHAGGITDTGIPINFMWDTHYQGLYFYRATETEDALGSGQHARIVVINATDGDIILPDQGSYTEAGAFSFLQNEDVDSPDFSASAHTPTGGVYAKPTSTANKPVNIGADKNVGIPGRTLLPHPTGKGVTPYFGVSSYGWQDDFDKGSSGAMTLRFQDPLADKFPIMSVTASGSTSSVDKSISSVAVGAFATQPSQRQIYNYHEQYRLSANITQSPSSMYWEYDLTSDTTTKRHVRMRARGEVYSSQIFNVVTITAIFETLDRSS